MLGLLGFDCNKVVSKVYRLFVERYSDKPSATKEYLQAFDEGLAS